MRCAPTVPINAKTSAIQTRRPGTTTGWLPIENDSSADRPHKMTTKEMSIIVDDRSPIPSDKVLSTNISISSAILWSGLSAGSPRRRMR